MKLIINDSTDAYFNLALEEYLLCNFCDDDLVVLWRNERTVVVGCNQNTVAEINADYVRQNGIKVVRRLTGGGAVYHDLGNVNYTFITDYTQGDFGNYSLFTQPVRDYLSSLGIKAELSGRNDLTINGMKFSGNAQTVKKGRIMHHGTLLFSSDVSEISAALRPPKAKIESHGIKSVRARVTNISAYLPFVMTVEGFMKGLEEYFIRGGTALYTLSENDIRKTENLRDTKYKTREWNYGQSPKYLYELTRKFPFGLVTVCLSVENSVITSVSFSGDFFGMRPITELSEILVGTVHDRYSLLDVLKSADVNSFISGMTSEELVSMLV